MLSNLLAVSAENMAKGYPKNISIGEAALFALLGFLMVFVGITLLIFIVWLVGKIINKATKKKAPVKKKEEKPDLSTVAEADELSEETVAVITVAIMAYYQEQPKKCEFTVKRIKKV
ncbi:MAG: hypothetical protein E7368_02100 [Clostridiales bacterium]|nr:hypothetical protein [Clostridiales bacterium]